MPISTTLAIIVVTSLVSFIAFSNRALRERLILWPPAIDRDNDWYRLVSYGAVHADGMHLLFNMITLYFFGTATERFYQAQLGDWGFLLFYLLGLVVSILPTYLRHRHDASYRSLGASGAVSGVLFAFILMQPWATIYIFFVPVPAIVFAVAYLAYTIWSDRQRKDHINHSAHLWGAVYGVAFTIAIEPAIANVFLTRLMNP